MALITLTTDFGTEDPYVAQMIGVIRNRAPGALIDHLTHSIAPQDILGCAFFLSQACLWFPSGTIHTALVDPGVGTERKAVAVRALESCFIVPDNGALTLLLNLNSDSPLPYEARTIESPALLPKTISSTFHGRDIFAPAAAYLAKGMPFEEIGPIAASEKSTSASLSALPIRQPEHDHKAEGGTIITGTVLRIDHFGNIISNITLSPDEQKRVSRVHIEGKTVTGLHRTYGEVPKGKLLSLIGSHGYLEVGCNQGSASQKTGSSIYSEISAELFS